MKKLLVVLCLIITVKSTSQKSWFQGNFFTNSNYYLDDSKTGDFLEENRFRSNNYLTLKAGTGSFSAGIQLESYAPMPLLNYSPSLDKELGISTYFANYKKDNLELTLGHFYEQFGSGVVLRFWEDKQLGINNALHGARIKYAPFEVLQMTALYGKQKAGFDLSNGSIFGVDTELDVGSMIKNDTWGLKVGLSYVARDEKINSDNTDFSTVTNAISGRFNLTNGGWYSNFEIVAKSEDALVELSKVNTEKLAKGKALLFNTGYSMRGFGVDATFRRLENMSFYSNRNAQGNIYNENLLNYLPSLTNQYDAGLANIYVYQSQYNLSFIPFGKAGEIGSQVNLFYSIKRNSSLGGKYGTKLALSFSNWYGLNADFDLNGRSYNSEFLSFGKKYFSDFNLEIRKKWSKKLATIGNFVQTYYSKKYIEETTGDVNASIAILDLNYSFSSGKSMRFEGQHLWTKDDKKNWLGATYEMNFSSTWSFFVTDLYNYGNASTKIHYYNFGGSFSRNGTRIMLNYGRQRGGYLCVGGVCRVVPETTGLGLQIATSF